MSAAQLWGGWQEGRRPGQKHAREPSFGVASCAEMPLEGPFKSDVDVRLVDAPSTSGQPNRGKERSYPLFLLRTATNIGLTERDSLV